LVNRAHGRNLDWDHHCVNDDAPLPQVVEHGAAVRFAVGTPDGSRSQSWVIARHGSRGTNPDTADDVFLGTRTQMKLIKLSLHQNVWRLAVQRPKADKLLISRDKRLLAMWPPTPEIGIDGSRWRVGAMIVVPPLALGPHWREADIGPVTFYPRSKPDHELLVIVLMGAAGAPEHILNPPFDGGRLDLAGGGTVRLWVNQAVTRPEWVAELRGSAGPSPDNQQRSYRGTGSRTAATPKAYLFLLTSMRSAGSTPPRSRTRQPGP
jgi:hypothetical protein